MLLHAHTVLTEPELQLQADLGVGQRLLHLLGEKMSSDFFVLTG